MVRVKSRFRVPKRVLRPLRRGVRPIRRSSGIFSQQSQAMREIDAIVRETQRLDQGNAVLDTFRSASLSGVDRIGAEVANEGFAIARETEDSARSEFAFLGFDPFPRKLLPKRTRRTRRR